MTVCLCCRADLTHGWSDQIVNGPVSQLDAASVQVRDGTEGVKTGVVDQFAPARPSDIGLVLGARLAPCFICLDELFRGVVLDLRI